MYIGTSTYISLDVWVFHLKPFVLPIDIQHNQCPCPILQSYNREMQVPWRQTYAAEIPHCFAVSRVDNAMPCHRTGFAIEAAGLEM